MGSYELSAPLQSCLTQGKRFFTEGFKLSNALKLDREVISELGETENERKTCLVSGEFIF